MNIFFKKTMILFDACRGYSLPISFLSWLVPFLYAITTGGSCIFGFLCLIGIITLHMASNIFDDAIDYTIEKKKIEKGLKNKFNFQSCKCKYIFNNELSLKQYYIISITLFFIASCIGLYFFNIYGVKLLYIIIPTAILCLSYPILGGLGLGEIIVGTIFSPLLYSGVFFVMTGYFSTEILLVSISTGLLVISVLHNHMLMDFKFDEENNKTTLCRICKTEKNALKLLAIIISLSYINLLIFILIDKLSTYYLIPLLSLPLAIKLYKDMGNKEISFVKKFLLPEKLLLAFTLLLCISVILDKCL